MTGNTTSAEVHYYMASQFLRELFARVDTHRFFKAYLGEEDKKSIADIVTEYIILYRRHMAAIQEDTSIPEDQKNTWSSLLAKRLEEIEGINN
jgi:alpha-amylase/alpha-mannosidase (GH57 family)